MGWFNRDNDEDIDDIYNKLNDIYNKLEALDVVNAFSGRLSRIEKTSTYLENVLMETVKELEKRVEKLESKSFSSPILDGSSINSNVDGVQFDLDYVKEDIRSIKKTLNNINIDNPLDSKVNQRMDDMDGVIKNLTLKISYLELAKERISNNPEDVESLKKQLIEKDAQIRQLNKKVESLAYIIEEDNRNIKMVAKHIIEQANAMKLIKEEISSLKNHDKTFQ